MANIFTNIKERVLLIPENKGIAKENFFIDLGVTYGNFKGKAKEKALSSDIVAKIITKYSDISPEWLLTGQGSMLKSEIKTYKSKSSEAINGSQDIPLYNIEATAGIVTLFKDAKKTEPIDQIHVPNLPKCDGAVYVNGDSMYPLLKSGDIVMYKKIDDVVNGLFWGEMYLISLDIDGDELVLVKFVQKSPKGDQWIKLVSQNQHHQDKEVHLSKVLALGLIKASIRINSMS